MISILTSFYLSGFIFVQLSKLALSAPNADDLVFGAEGHVDDGFVFAVVKPLSSTEEQRSLFTTTSYG